jgi:hypothetical protein
MQISSTIPPLRLSASLLDRAVRSRLRLLIVLRWLLGVWLWLLDVLPLSWRRYLLLLVLSQRFEAFVSDTEECAVFDAVFDETHSVFLFTSSQVAVAGHASVMWIKKLFVLVWSFKLFCVGSCLRLCL